MQDSSRMFILETMGSGISKDMIGLEMRSSGEERAR